MKLHLGGSHLLFLKSFSPIAEVGHCHPDRENAEGAVGPSCLAYDLLPFPCIMYEWHLESKERFAIKKYLLTIGKKKNMQVLSHTFTYFST